MFPVLGSRQFCICGAVTDCFGDHALVCPQITVRNQTRNTAHSHGENVYRKIIVIYRNFDAKLLNSYFATVSGAFLVLTAPILLFLLLSIQNLKYKLA